MSTKAQRINAAHHRLNTSCAELRVHEVLWAEEWASYPNPFIAVERYCSEEARARRQPVMQAWLDATENLYFVRFGRHSTEQKTARITNFMADSSANFATVKAATNKPKFQTKAAI